MSKEFNNNWLKKDYEPKFKLFCKNCDFFIKNIWKIENKVISLYSNKKQE